MDRDDLTLEDRAAVDDFTAFLSGSPACLLCMTPSAACGGKDDPCCPNCRHARVVACEGPPASPYHARPFLLVRDRG